MQTVRLYIAVVFAAVAGASAALVPTHNVDLASQSPVPPYTNRSTAAGNNIQALEEKGDTLKEMYKNELQLVIIPPEHLPVSCRFAPYNPAIITNRQVLPLILIPVMMHSGNLGFKELTDELEAGFSAVYHDGDIRRDIGVNMLLFNQEDIARQRFQQMQRA